MPLSDKQETVPSAADEWSQEEGEEDDPDQIAAEADAAAKKALDEANATALVVPETFSDIDDDEIEGYMATPEEIELKTVIWSEMNKCAYFPISLR
jgi:transcription factor IIIB subunit 2